MPSSRPIWISNGTRWSSRVIRFPGATKRTLHFDRWLHFAHELYLRNKVEIYFAGTELMMADFFTKPVDKTKFLECRDYLLTRVE